jgi:hypothetical protein
VLSRDRERLSDWLRVVPTLWDAETPLLRNPTPEEKATLDQWRDEVTWLKTTLNGAVRHGMSPETAIQVRALTDDWHSFLAGAQSAHAAGVVSLVQPGIEAFLNAARKTARARSNTAINGNEAEWDRAYAERDRIRRMGLGFGAVGDEIFRVLQLLEKNTMVPLPTFAEIDQGDLGLDFAMRIAPLGLVGTITAGLFPFPFYRHDIVHGSIYAARGLDPVERFLAEQGAFMRALPAFMRKLEADGKEAFFLQVHETYHDPLKSEGSPALGWERTEGFLKEELEKAQGDLLDRGSRVESPGLTERLKGSSDGDGDELR